MSAGSSVPFVAMSSHVPLSTGTVTPQPPRGAQYHQGSGKSASHSGSGSGTAAPAGCVQPASVQDQFASLHLDRDRFRLQREQAQGELARIQEEYQALQQEQAELVTMNHQAQAELGDQTNQVRMLKEERARIIRLTENEGRAVRDCTNHTKTMEQQREAEAKKAFINEMQAISDQMASLLQRRMLLKTEEFVTAQSVADAVAMIEKQNNCTLVNIKKPHDELVEATQARNKKRAHLLELLHALEELRENGTMDDDDGVMEVEDGEAASATKGNETTMISPAQGAQGSEHMERFYGPQS
jgi:hypothetical protein